MPRSSILLAAIITTCAAVAPMRAVAEIVIAESIEAVVAGSDRVVAGRVVAVDSVAGNDGVMYEVAMLAITRTLKGAHEQRIPVLLRDLGGRYAGQWLREGLPMLFCLVANDGERIPIAANRYRWALRDDGNEHDAVYLHPSASAWTGCIPVLTVDFDVLVTADTILKHVERVVAGLGNRPKPAIETVDVAYESPVWGRLWSGSMVMLRVPVDAHLEALARQRCASASLVERSEGARLLRHFRNEENVQILTGLLAEARSAPSRRRQAPADAAALEQDAHWSDRIRETAGESLRALGVSLRPGNTRVGVGQMPSK